MMSQKHTYGINILGDPAQHSVADQIKMVKDASFDAFFTAWDKDATKDIAKAAEQNGLQYYSIHAPCHQTPSLWRAGEEGDAALLPLLDCVRDCARFAIPVMVIHPSIGYVVPTDFTVGLTRYGRLLELAERLGVTVGFENLESEACLAAVMQTFGSSPACGFCLDTGHEQCHNHGKDMMALYGEKLCHTHLNDNLGVLDKALPIDLSWKNDLHLMMGDGIVDWKGVMDRIDASPYRGPLMCELKLTPSPGRTDHDAYRAMPLSDFYALALERVRRVAAREI